MIHCPRCDKPLAPGHRCLNRRHFFGMLAGAAAAILAPKLAPVPPPAFELMGMPVISSAGVPVGALSPYSVIHISNQLFRIPIQLYRGGAFAKYEHGGDLGIGSPRWSNGATQ